MAAQWIAIAILLLLLVGGACWVIYSGGSQENESRRPRGPMAKLATWTEPQIDLEAQMQAVWRNVLGDTEGMSWRAISYGVDDIRIGNIEHK